MTPEKTFNVNGWDAGVILLCGGNEAKDVPNWIKSIQINMYITDQGK